MKKLIYLYFAFITGIAPSCFSQNLKSDVIPNGRIESFSFSESKIFPGTQRIVTVYIPQQIDSKVPACVHVQQDGFKAEQNLNLIFDTLIAKKEMPVTVCVFVSSGYLPSTKKLNLILRSFLWRKKAPIVAIIKAIIGRIIPVGIRGSLKNLSRKNPADKIMKIA